MNTPLERLYTLLRDVGLEPIAEGRVAPVPRRSVMRSRNIIYVDRQSVENGEVLQLIAKEIIRLLMFPRTTIYSMIASTSNNSGGGTPSHNKQVEHIKHRNQLAPWGRTLERA